MLQHLADIPVTVYVYGAVLLVGDPPVHVYAVVVALLITWHGLPEGSA